MFRYDRKAGRYLRMAYISTVHDRAYTLDTGGEGQQRKIAIEGVTHDIDCARSPRLPLTAGGRAA